MWPAIWWNLNVQLTYWPFYAANHLDEASPLIDTLWNGRAMLARNAKPFEQDSYAIGRATGPGLECAVGRELGNLPWIMHNLWQHYRMSMDDVLLRERILPLMIGSFRYLDHLLISTNDGRLHLPESASPEYAEHAKDCSYTTACLRWLASAIIQAETRLKISKGTSGRCQIVLDQLAPYPVGDSGFLVGKDLPLTSSHRHWSHLFMIYPFNEYSLDQADQKDLVERSIAHWLSMPKEFTGFSSSAAASIAALNGHGDEALSHLHNLFAFSGVLPNTMSRETGPVIETSLSAARSLQDMLLQSHGGIIRVFPAIPATWQDVSFADLRAEGAFLISARRHAGKTDFIRIHSLAGEPCRIRTGLNGTIMVSSQRSVQRTEHGHGEVTLDLRRGETAVVYAGTLPTDLTIAPVALTGPEVRWGFAKP